MSKSEGEVVLVTFEFEVLLEVSIGTGVSELSGFSGEIGECGDLGTTGEIGGGVEVGEVGEVAFDSDSGLPAK